LKRPNLTHIIEGISDLPTLPGVVGQVLDAAADPDSSALDLAKFITADQSLCASILRVVNSSYFGFMRQIDSITTAIVILGFVAVRNMVVTAMAFQSLGRPGSSCDRLQLWRHALATAVAAERSTRRAGLSLNGCPFVAGLLHDIGKVAFHWIVAERYAAITERANEEHEPIRVLEEKELGMDHAEAGSLLAVHWNMPETIVDAIRYHHMPQLGLIDLQLDYLTAFADCVAYEAGLGDAGNGVKPTFPDEAGHELQIDRSDFEELVEEVANCRPVIDELLGALNT